MEKEDLIKELLKDETVKSIFAENIATKVFDNKFMEKWIEHDDYGNSWEEESLHNEIKKSMREKTEKAITESFEKILKDNYTMKRLLEETMSKYISETLRKLSNK